MVTIPMIVMLLGLVLYHLTLPPKVTETGRIAFWCGLLITLYAVATKVLV